MSQQQQTCTVLFTEAQRKVIGELLPDLADRLKLDEKNARTILFTTDELETIQQKAEAARPHAENGMKRNSLRHQGNRTSRADGPRIAMTPCQ